MNLKSLKAKTIGVLYGGTSAERGISLLTGKAILKALKTEGFHAVAIDVGPDAARDLRRSEIDIACAMVERERSNFSAEITWRASDEYRQRLIAHVRASKAKVLAQEIKASAIDEAKDILQEMATDNNQEPKRDLAFEIASGLNTGN